MDKYIVGLTGIMGSGKSLVAKIANEFGVYVIDADKVALDILENDEEIRSEINERWIRRVLIYDDIKTCRNSIASIIFDDDKEYEWYNGWMMPKIFTIIKSKIWSSDKQIIIVDAPLLFETKFDNEVDETWVVRTSVEKVIERVLQRNPGITEKIINKIMSKQWTQDEKLRRADFTIDNYDNDFLTKSKMWYQVKEMITDIKIKML